MGVMTIRTRVYNSGTGGKRILRSDLQNRGRALGATILMEIL